VTNIFTTEVIYGVWVRFQSAWCMMFVSSYMTRVISGAGTANLCQCSSRFSMEFELFNL